jgi:hypothetical protein
MRRIPGGQLRRYAAVFVAGALAASAIGIAVGEIKHTSTSDGTPIHSVRPTGVGLPLVGAEGTLGAGDYADSLKDYHDSGAYDQDLKKVGRAAGRYLKKRVAALRARPGPTGKLALVLDVDETSLSNYSYISSTNFSGTLLQLALAVVGANDPPIEPTLDLYNLAQRKGVKVFFITGRPESIPQVREQTEGNLESAGYEDWAGLTLNPGGEGTVEYKSGERAQIEKKGFRIILNVGDQESDLQGGHADRAFKLPNPFYFIGP